MTESVKTAVKKPQDRKPKADADTLTATVRGVEITVKKRDLEDYRVARLMATARGGDGIAGIMVLDLILGDDQHTQLAETVAEADGHIDQQKMAEVTKELFDALAPNS